MNEVEMTTSAIFSCLKCTFSCYNLCELIKHKNCNTSSINLNTNKQFKCIICNYECSKICNLKKHELTFKHSKKSVKSYTNTHYQQYFCKKQILPLPVDKLSFNKKTEYIYLLIEREFLKTNEAIYKLGRTSQINYERLNNYSKGTKLLFQIICENSQNVETLIINEFKKKYYQCKHIGIEYFSGDFCSMIDDIQTIVKLNNTKCDIETKDINESNNNESNNNESNNDEGNNDESNNDESNNDESNNYTKNTYNLSKDFNKKKYVCKCGKMFVYSQGLSKHKKTCFITKK
jgi:T5orf172 domain